MGASCSNLNCKAAAKQPSKSLMTTSVTPLPPSSA